MREIMHFNSEKEKIAYLKGDFTEVTPVEVAEEKPKKKPKKAKKTEQKGEEDEVQAE